MSSSIDTATQTETAPQGVEPFDVLAREAGVPFRAAVNDDAPVDPIVEWLDLMEVVQMLCPAWPVRVSPMQGKHWRL